MRVWDLGRGDGEILSEDEFFDSYRWCLNPILQLGELFQRLREELDRYERLRVRWQREEGRINLYLLACAIACTVDDYLAWRRWDLSLIVDRFPRFRFAAPVARWFLNMPDCLWSVVEDRSVVRWRRRWEPCVDRVSEILIGGDAQHLAWRDGGRGVPGTAGSGLVDRFSDGAVEESERGDREWTHLRRMLLNLLNSPLPSRVLEWRMRVPEAFRCQDLTHHDVVSMVRNFLESQRDLGSRTVVIGVRTAGAYFAPLVKACLEAPGEGPVSWMTIRPKDGLSRREKRRLQSLVDRESRVLVIDDHPNTGRTLRLMVGLVGRCGVRPEQITILAPRHPVRPAWTLPEEVQEGVKLIALEPAEFYKQRLLNPDSVESLIRDHYRDRGWTEVQIQESRDVDTINSDLWQHYPDGFHVRLKRVFEVQLAANGRKPLTKRIFAKSVGWGWLGYHAYITGTRLAGFVPPVITLREGLLFTEWLEGGGQNGVVGSMPLRLSSYIAGRVERLRLAEDPCFASRGYRWTGWDEMIKILAGVYSPYVGRFKIRALRRELRRYVSPIPTLVDGQMKPDEWIEIPSGIYKVDFEHHNFGGAELDVVDSAYDLAATIFEFQLSGQDERQLLKAYTRESADQTISDRLILYKLLYGVRTMRRAAYSVARERSEERREACNHRYLSARNFLVYQMNRFCAGLLVEPRRAEWSKHLFFLDLDGVFDRELLGFSCFPHTTISGLRALELLRSHGIAIVLNTGRSVEHVRNYCETYRLPGGIAEYGGVFVDFVAQRELGLIDAEAAAQLLDCREAIERVPGVFVDPDYRYSVRAYRYSGERTAGLDPDEVRDVLARLRCDRLTFISRLADTYIVQKGRDKGAGLSAAKRFLGCADGHAAAIGDSEEDLPMLEAADLGYAPASCAAKVREMAEKARYRIMADSYQRGLLAGVRNAISDWGLQTADGEMRDPWHADAEKELLGVLLRIAERSRVRELLAALNWRGL